MAAKKEEIEEAPVKQERNDVPEKITLTEDLGITEVENAAVRSFDSQFI